MLLAVAFTFGTAVASRTQIPAVFVGQRVFATPSVAGTLRRLHLWIDSDGSGFIRSDVVADLHWPQTSLMQGGKSVPATFLPQLSPPSFPPIKLDGGRLPILDATQVKGDPIFADVDGQLGGSWLCDRIWTIDYASEQFWLDQTAPAAASADIVPLTFDRAHRYPSLEIAIDGRRLHASLDTAATVALSEKALRALDDGLPAVRATSFIPRATLAAWHQQHPDWPYIADAGSAPGIALIRVPEVRASRVTFRNVWFSTRPDDDVFAGENVDAKLGPTAFGDGVVTLDYVHDDAVFVAH